LIASGYDQDLSFVLVEIAGDALSFQTISRLGGPLIQASSYISLEEARDRMRGR